LRAHSVAQLVFQNAQYESDTGLVDWLKKNPDAPVVKREAEEEWGQEADCRAAIAASPAGS